MPKLQTKTSDARINDMSSASEPASKIDDASVASKLHALQTYMSLYEKVKAENSALKEESKKREHDHSQVSSYLQKDLELKNTQLRNLLKKMEDMQDDYEERLKLKDLELSSRRTEYEMTQTNLNSEFDKMKEDMKELEKLQIDKKELKEALRRKEMEIDVMKANFETELTKLKVKFEEEKIALKAEEELLRRALLEEVHQKAMSLVGRKSKEIHQENIELMDQQRTLGRDLVDVGQLKTNLEVENRQLTREKDLIEDSLKMYAKQAVRVGREIKELHAKIEQLELKLEQQQECYVREKTELIYENNQSSEKLKRELAEKQNLVVVRTRELLHLKKLAERILHQRTEFEMFFAEAFSFVKSQKLKDSRTLLDSEHTQAEFPPINLRTMTKNNRSGLYNVLGKMRKVKRSSADSPHLATIVQSDFTRLTWEEKEMVLKILFNKLNHTLNPDNPRVPEQKQTTGRISEFSGSKRTLSRVIPKEMNPNSPRTLISSFTDSFEE